MALTHPETALVPYIRGELAGAERERVAEHLSGCTQCRESADSFRSLLANIAARLDELPTPDWSDYRAELRRKLAARPEPRAPWWRTGFAWGGGLAAAAAAAALVIWLSVPGLRPPSSAPIDDQLAFAQQADVVDVGLLRNYGVVQRLDLLENYDVIEHLDQLRPAPKPSDAVQS
jgi:anti-sigma factor RsiW